MNGNAVLAWISVAGFSLATAWAQFAESPLPLAGLRGFSPPVLGWSLVLATLPLAIFLTMGRFHTRTRLRAGSAYSAALFLAVAFFASMVAPVLLIFISASLFKETRMPLGYNALR